MDIKDPLPLTENNFKIRFEIKTHSYKNFIIFNVMLVSEKLIFVFFIQDSLETERVLIETRYLNQNENLTTLNSSALQLNELSTTLDYQSLAKKVHEEFAALDKENISVAEFRNKWCKVEPSGDTPQKQNYKYDKSLIEFSTPVAAKNLNLDDSSLLDISVGSVNISLAPPEGLENLEELLQEQVCWKKL